MRVIFVDIPPGNRPAVPDAIHDTRDQGQTWNEIAQLLNTSPASARRRYRPAAPTP
jgi:hypothetical protein